MVASVSENIEYLWDSGVVMSRPAGEMSGAVSDEARARDALHQHPQRDGERLIRAAVAALVEPELDEDGEEVVALNCHRALEQEGGSSTAGGKRNWQASLRQHLNILLVIT